MSGCAICPIVELATKLAEAHGPMRAPVAAALVLGASCGPGVQLVVCDECRAQVERFAAAHNATIGLVDGSPS